MCENNLTGIDATASENVQSINMNVRASREEKIEKNKRMLYNLNCNLQDVLFATIKAYGELDKLNFNSNVVDDSEIIEHYKLLIAILKKIDLIIAYLLEIQESIEQYDDSHLFISKLSSEIAKMIDDFLIDNLPAEDIAIKHDDLSDLKWIKTKTDDDAVVTKKFIRASKR